MKELKDFVQNPTKKTGAALLKKKGFEHRLDRACSYTRQCTESPERVYKLQKLRRKLYSFFGYSKFFRFYDDDIHNITIVGSDSRFDAIHVPETPIPDMRPHESYLEYVERHYADNALMRRFFEAMREVGFIREENGISNSMTSEHLDELRMWSFHRIHGPRMVFFDFDLTISHVNGYSRDIVSMLGPSGGEAYARYIMGTPERFLDFQNTIATIVQNGVTPFILTSNGSCSAPQFKQIMRALSPEFVNDRIICVADMRDEHGYRVSKKEAIYRTPNTVSRPLKRPPSAPPAREVPKVPKIGDVVSRGDGGGAARPTPATYSPGGGAARPSRPVEDPSRPSPSVGGFANVSATYRGPSRTRFTKPPSPPAAPTGPPPVDTSASDMIRRLAELVRQLPRPATDPRLRQRTTTPKPPTDPRLRR